MYTVYVLKDVNGILYKGMTNNIDRRLKEHRRGKTNTTKRMENVQLVYQEKYDSFEVARERELYLKSASGRRYLKTKLTGA